MLILCRVFLNRSCTLFRFCGIHISDGLHVDVRSETFKCSACQAELLLASRPPRLLFLYLGDLLKGHLVDDFLDIVVIVTHAARSGRLLHFIEYSLADALEVFFHDFLTLLLFLCIKETAHGIPSAQSTD